jgi:membrane protein implicated in regulation of membrane protease activity
MGFLILRANGGTMKILRHMGSLAFVLGLFLAVFAGIPWHVIVADDPAVPWWLKAAVFCLLGGILLVLLTVVLEQKRLKKGAAVEFAHRFAPMN